MCSIKRVSGHHLGMADSRYPCPCCGLLTMRRVGSLFGPSVKKLLAEDVDMNDKGTE